MGFVGEVVFVSGSSFCYCYEYICKFGCPVSFEAKSQSLGFFGVLCTCSVQMYAAWLARDTEDAVCAEYVACECW